MLFGILRTAMTTARRCGIDGQDTLYHINGLGVAGKWSPLAIVLRTSRDSGYTWSKARMIVPEFGFRQMVGWPVFRTKDGSMVFGADAGRGSTVYVSHDKGQTWADAGGHIRGIHAAIAEGRDGRLMAYGRGEEIDGRMSVSYSSDLGKTWISQPSVLPPISGGQRAVLLRLKEGPLFLASFAEDANNFQPSYREDGRRHVSSLFGAVSFDDGKTWPVRRVISPGIQERGAETIDRGQDPHERKLVRAARLPVGVPVARRRGSPAEQYQPLRVQPGLAQAGPASGAAHAA